MILVETIFDTLNAKAALYAIETYYEELQVCVDVASNRCVHSHRSS